jgi:hypothetical protein
MAGLLCGDMVAAMDAVGVDGALLVSAFTMYRYDASYALEVHAAHPGRFRVIKPVDPTDCPTTTEPLLWARLSSGSITGRHRRPDRLLVVELIR